MAEFKEVIRQWTRMGENRCTTCPLADECDDYYIKYNASEPICGTLNDKADKVEIVVMAWAAENPEPVYETWGEWFLRTCQVPTHDGRENDWFSLINSRIPPDIAQRLGLKPKEVENNG